MLRQLIIGVGIILLLTPSSLAGTGEAKVGSPAPNFSLQDQYDQEFDLSKYRDTVVLLIYGDREGSEFNGEWLKAVNERYNQPGHAQVKLVLIANLEGVPGFVHGFVKKRFQGTTPQGNPKRSVLLDWEGVVAQLYGFQQGLSNVYLIDHHGLLRYMAAGRGAPQDLEPLFQAIDRVLSTR